MAQWLQIPHGLLRRHLTSIERLLIAGGVAALLSGMLHARPVYPLHWDVFIIAVVFLSTLASTSLGYTIAVLVTLYPLYELSLYLAVLFLAVALLGHHLFIRNLGATILVLAAPWLAGYRLAWVIPLLGGLWWGKLGGLWMGGLAALWGQVIAGMSGANPDWLNLLGGSPDVGSIIQRFGDANSLETLLLIAAPLAPDTTFLLYHLLQVLTWAAIGGLVGGFAEHAWTQKHQPQGSILIAAAAAFALLGAHLALSLWLKPSLLPTLSWEILLWATLLTAGTVAALEWLRDFMEHPLPIQRSKLSQARRQADTESNYTPLPIPTELPEDQASEDKDDLIMLELD